MSITGDSSGIGGVEAFFSNETPPSNLSSTSMKLFQFLEKQKESNRLVACVTSGGTMVPLEKNVVRSIENFSTGSRGAACTEHFLAKGYAVIFLHRPGSVYPFAKHIQSATSKHIDGKFLEHFAEEGDNRLELQIKGEKNQRAASNALAGYRAACREERFFPVEYETVVDYLFLLKVITENLNEFGHRAILVLAAAVSDFYIPSNMMSAHKIQSREGSLALELQQVPKMLKHITKWAKRAFFVSFKLETDESLLIKKAKMATEIGMHLVVANELHTRYQRVILVSKDGECEVVKHDSRELEVDIVDQLTQFHHEHIGNAGVKGIRFESRYSPGLLMYAAQRCYRQAKSIVSAYRFTSGAVFGAAVIQSISIIKSKR